MAAGKRVGVAACEWRGQAFSPLSESACKMRVAVSANSVVPKKSILRGPLRVGRLLIEGDVDGRIRCVRRGLSPPSRPEVETRVEEQRPAARAGPRALRMVGGQVAIPLPVWDSARVERPAAAVAAVCRARCVSRRSSPRFMRRCTRRRAAPAPAPAPTRPAPVAVSAKIRRATPRRRRRSARRPRPRPPRR